MTRCSNIRPRPLSAKVTAEKKSVLRRRTHELLIFARTIHSRQEQFEEDKDDLGWCFRRRVKNKIARDKKKLSIEYLKLEKEIQIFQLEMSLRANPLLDVLQLVGGILLSIVGLVLWAHVLVFKIVQKKGAPLSGFLNDFMLFVEFKMARFFSTVIFIAIGESSRSV